MSGFIPMVSTTPPPIGDDDFGDFMDSSQAEPDDFADFSSSVNYDDFSCPSLNSPDGDTQHANFNTEEESSAANKDSFIGNKTKRDVATDKEVEVILMKTQIGVKEGGSSDSLEENVPTCNSGTDPVLSNGNDEEHATHPWPDNNDSINSDDWMDFNAVSPDSEISGCTDPTEIVPSDIPTIQSSPQFEDLQPSSNSVCSQQSFQSSPSPPTNDKFEAFSSVDTGEVLDHKIEGKIPEGTALENLESSSINEDLKDSHTIVIGKSDSDGGNVGVTEDLNDLKDAEEDFEESDHNKEQYDDAELNQLQNAYASDSSAEFNDFASTKPDSNIALEQSAENHIDIESVTTTDFVGSQGNSDLYCSEQTNGRTTPQDMNQDIEVVCSKAESAEAFVEGKSSIPETSPEPEAFEADFGAFSSETGENEGFADFGSADMHSSPDVTDQADQREISHNIPANDDSEFAGFETSSGDGFADFSDAQSPEGDDFGDFSSSGCTLSTWPAFSNTVTKRLSLKEKIATYGLKYSECGGVEPENQLEHIPHLDEHLNSEALSSAKNAGSPSTASVESIGIVCPGGLWYQLEDIDNAAALNFMWNGSGHNKHLLESLGMFTQNILFSGAKQAYYVPTYYAAGLGLIDPSKGILKPMSAAEKITAMSPTEKNVSTAKEDLHPDETHTEWKTIADDLSSRSCMNLEGSWLRDDQVLSNRTGSELTIDRDPVPIISSTMDLDFFDSLPSVGDGGKVEGSADLIDPELLELTSAPTTDPPPPTKDFGSATLSKILSSITTSNSTQSASNIAPGTTQENSKWDEEESKLSNEARSVLKRLPNLSYMKAKVLMFPINMSRVTIGED